MLDDFRHFTLSDPFGRAWDVELRWQQNAISIRHADAVDCKYYIASGDERRELVVSLPHPDLLAVAAEAGRELTDAWVIRLAALHVCALIAEWREMERTLVVTSRAELQAYNAELERQRAASAAAHR
jgi:hypothetical protein